MGHTNLTENFRLMGQKHVQFFPARRGFDRILQAVGAPFVRANPERQKFYRTPGAGIFRAPWLYPVVLRQAAFKVFGHAAIIGAVRAFQKVDLPEIRIVRCDKRERAGRASSGSHKGAGVKGYRLSFSVLLGVNFTAVDSGI